MPQLIHILFNSSVGAELAGAGHVEYGGLCPPFFVPVSLVHPSLGVPVRHGISQDKIGIRPVYGVAAEQRVVDVPEQPRIARPVSDNAPTAFR